MKIMDYIIVFTLVILLRVFTPPVTNLQSFLEGAGVAVIYIGIKKLILLEKDNG